MVHPLVLVRTGLFVATALLLIVILGGCSASLRANGDELIGGEVSKNDR